MATNEAERRRWNDERWSSVWLKRERLTSKVTPFLLEALAPRAGERIVDIGCGGGTAAFAAAEAVGADGGILGVDISVSLSRLAAERAEAAGLSNVRFEVADAQTDGLAGAPFDAAMSQFGVMFFDEPVTAFRNVLSSLRSGGRLAFACWQSIEAEPLVRLSCDRGLPAAAPEPVAGKSPTGPFALAEPARTRSILEEAGFADVRRRAYTVEAEVPQDSVVDEAQLVCMGVREEALVDAMAAVASYMRRFVQDDGSSRFPLAFQVVSAVRP